MPLVIGELESEVLQVLQSKKEDATAGEVLQELKKKKEIAYTTVSTTLDRLYRKRLVERRAEPGPGGTRYLFSVAKDQKMMSKIIESSIGRLTNAFGEGAYSALYKQIDNMPAEELERLKKQVERVLQRRSSR